MPPYRLKQDIVTETVRNWLLSGRYHPGDQLPPDQILCQEFNMNQRTVAAGLRPLVQENLLERAPRRGTIVSHPLMRPVTNAVAVLAFSQGDIYQEMAHAIDERLAEHNLYTVYIDHRLVDNQDSLVSYLKRLTHQQQPYGFIAIGNTSFPYQLLSDFPDRYANTVFLFRYHHDVELPQCRYVLTDYAAMGKQAVNYFAAKGVRHIIFDAKFEKHYQGIWSSSQVMYLQGLLEWAKLHRITVDEELFWKLHGGAPHDETLRNALLQAPTPLGIVTISDAHLVQQTLPVLEATIPESLEQVHLIGCYNTSHAQQFHVTSMDINLHQAVDAAITMMTGNANKRKVFITPRIVEHP